MHKLICAAQAREGVCRFLSFLAALIRWLARLGYLDAENFKGFHRGFPIKTQIISGPQMICPAGQQRPGPAIPLCAAKRNCAGTLQPNRSGALRSTPEHYGYSQTMSRLGRITLDPNKRGGKPCIRGLRITVYDVLEYLAAGMTESEILTDFPDLEREDIRASLAFAAERERRLVSIPRD